MGDILEFYQIFDDIEDLKIKSELAEEFKVILVGKMMSSKNYRDFLAENKGANSVKYNDLAVFQDMFKQLNSVIDNLERRIDEAEEREDDKDSYYCEEDWEVDRIFGENGTVSLVMGL